MKQTIRGMPVPNLERVAWKPAPLVAPAAPTVRTPKPTEMGLPEPGRRSAARKHQALTQRGDEFQRGAALLAVLMVPLALMVPLDEHRLERQGAVPGAPVPPSQARAPSIEPEPAEPPKAIAEPAVQLSSNAQPTRAQQASGHAEFAASTVRQTSKLDASEPARASAVLSLASLSPEDVVTLQRELQRRGLYSGAIDGLVGPVTTDGLIEAERRRSEREQQAIRDGHVGAALWNELNGGPRAAEQR